ncbi:MAG: hypothetical protein IKB75_01675 [Clostridia bacterium]|nr:hypothetical protein [Clostridia bacterium]
MMSRRILALLLCAVMLIPCLASCAKEDKDNPDLGPYITMYLSDEIYDLDPANTIYNKESQAIAAMLFDTLFKLDEDGKVKKSLVKSYKISENERDNDYSMTLVLKEAYWSTKSLITSDDVVFTFKRLLNSNNSFAAASLLYDIKNARAIKDGDCSIDDLGVEAVEQNTVKITFEGKINYDQFMLNLTNVATAPLLESYVNKNPDWAKKASTIATSGPFKLGKINYADELSASGNPVMVSDDNAIKANGKVEGGLFNKKAISFFYLERNLYYYRDFEHDKVTKSVTPYRLLVDCSKTDDEIYDAYKNGDLFYIGDIPLSIRDKKLVKNNVEITDALSTFVLLPNQNAVIKDRYSGEETRLFANADVRQALSLAIDRKTIAKAIVYADAATALVGHGIFEGITNGKKDFRDVGGKLIATSPNVEEAAALLANAGIDAQRYSFSISVSLHDDVNIAIAEMVAEAWGALGFEVTVKKMDTIQNNDYLAEIGEPPSDVCDDQMHDALTLGTYEVAAFDYHAFSADAYSMLSSFAFAFSGMAMTNDPLTNTYTPNGHTSGYNSKAFNDIMEAIYYLPYFATLTEEDWGFLGIYDTKQEYQDVYYTVQAIYDEHGITPSKDPKDWTKQRAKLLHEAENILILDDMAIIPVVFNKHAVLIHDDLSKVSATYYAPAIFQKTKLKNYKDYVAELKEFPGKKEEAPAEE